MSLETYDKTHIYLELMSTHIAPSHKFDVAKSIEFIIFWMIVLRQDETRGKDCFVDTTNSGLKKNI